MMLRFLMGVVLLVGTMVCLPVQEASAQNGCFYQASQWRQLAGQSKGAVEAKIAEIQVVINNIVAIKSSVADLLTYYDTCSGDPDDFGGDMEDIEDALQLASVPYQAGIPLKSAGQTAYDDGELYFWGDDFYPPQYCTAVSKYQSANSSFQAALIKYVDALAKYQAAYADLQALKLAIENAIANDTEC